MITHSQVTVDPPPPPCCFKPVVQLIDTKLHFALPQSEHGETRPQCQLTSKCWFTGCDEQHELKPDELQEEFKLKGQHHAKKLKLTGFYSAAEETFSVNFTHTHRESGLLSTVRQIDRVRLHFLGWQVRTLCCPEISSLQIPHEAAGSDLSNWLLSTLLSRPG